VLFYVDASELVAIFHKEVSRRMNFCYWLLF